jgi:formylmethanofuran dehydrogenase subunit E
MRILRKVKKEIQRFLSIKESNKKKNCEHEFLNEVRKVFDVPSQKTTLSAALVCKKCGKINLDSINYGSGWASLK